jgi:hypothetical protein
MVFALPRPSSSETVNDWTDESIGKAADMPAGPAGIATLRTDAPVLLASFVDNGCFL